MVWILLRLLSWGGSQGATRTCKRTCTLAYTRSTVNVILMPCPGAAPLRWPGTHWCRSRGRVPSLDSRPSGMTITKLWQSNRQTVLSRAQRCSSAIALVVCYPIAHQALFYDRSVCPWYQSLGLGPASVQPVALGLFCHSNAGGSYFRLVQPSLGAKENSIFTYQESLLS